MMSTHSTHPAEEYHTEEQQQGEEEPGQGAPELRRRDQSIRNITRAPVFPSCIGRPYASTNHGRRESVS
ncbi:hypothetical protein WJX79_000599 [Trebouxia sp. C0005]